MVPKTSELLPDPETPVKTVSRRLGISTLMSLRLFSRAPCTRIRSWLSAHVHRGRRGPAACSRSLRATLSARAAPRPSALAVRACSVRPGISSASRHAWTRRAEHDEDAARGRELASRGSQPACAAKRWPVGVFVAPTSRSRSTSSIARSRSGRPEPRPDPGRAGCRPSGGSSSATTARPAVQANDRRHEVRRAVGARTGDPDVDGRRRQPGEGVGLRSSGRAGTAPRRRSAAAR